MSKEEYLPPEKQLKEIANTGGNQEKIRESDLLDIFNFREHKGEYIKLRILPPKHIFSSMVHWVEIEYTDKDTNKTKTTVIPKASLSWDIKRAEHIPGAVDPYLDNSSSIKIENSSVYFYLNAIIRHLEDEEPKKESKRDKWTPVRIIKVPKSVINQLSIITEEQNDGHPVFDANKGTDLKVRFDPNKKNKSEIWSVIPVKEPSKLSDKELDYKIHDIGKALKTLQNQETLEQAQQEVKKFMGNSNIKYLGDDEREAKRLKKQKKKGKGKKKKKNK